MTNEQAIKELQESYDIMRNHDIDESESYLMQALNMAIEALQAQADGEKSFKMRDATPEEQESIDKYIKSISKPTGVNFWNLADGEYISKEKAIIQLSWDLSEVELPRIKESLDKLPSVAIPPEHDGCKDCKYVNHSTTEEPCVVCKQNYMDKWEKAPQWIHTEECDEEFPYRCSKCNLPSRSNGHRYCPNCGSYMYGHLRKFRMR